MALDIDETIVPYKAFPQEGTARNTEQMPLLIADGRVPLSVAGLMERRLNSSKTAWGDNYFDCGDGIAYAAGGKKFKIVLDAPQLRTLTQESPLMNGALVLEDGVYETLQGQEFVRENLANLLERNLTADEAKTHPLWKVFARDESLLTAYVDKMFSEMKERFKYNAAMGLYLASGEKVPTLRAACVLGLGGGSQLGGWCRLGSGIGRLVGVAPEALSAQGKAIEARSK